MGAEVPAGRGGAAPSPGHNKGRLMPKPRLRRFPPLPGQGPSPVSDAGARFSPLALGEKAGVSQGTKQPKNISLGAATRWETVSGDGPARSGSGAAGIVRASGFCRCFTGNQTKCRLWEPRCLACLFPSARCRALKPAGLTCGVIGETRNDFVFLGTAYANTR